MMRVSNSVSQLLFHEDRFNTGKGTTSNAHCFELKEAVPCEKKKINCVSRLFSELIGNC